MSDGPKWVCDVHRIKKLAKARQLKDPSHPGCVVYSIGSNGDIGFERGIQRELGEGTCEFHIFDNMDFEIPGDLKRAYFHKWFLKKQDPSVGAPTKGLREYGLHDSIKLLGHENLDVIDIFKIDCEQCEWETFNDWLSPNVPRLQQIQVEVHKAPGQTAINFFDTLEESGYLMFHKEPNIRFDPSSVEFSFVKVDKSFMQSRH